MTITLRRRTSFNEASETLFVWCSERDCQYADTNEPPCPLTLELFRDELHARMSPPAG